MDFVTILAYATTIWGMTMACAPLLQIARVLQRQDSRDISLGYLIVLQIGFALWLAYGIAIAEWPLILANGLATITGLVMLAVVWRFRGGPAGA